MKPDFSPKHPLYVLMAATSFPRNKGDWKGRFIFDLADSLGERDDLDLRIWAPAGDTPIGVSFADRSDARWLARMLEQGGIAHLLRRKPLRGLFTAAGILRRLKAAGARMSPQIYHFNWLQLALGLPDDHRPAYVSVLGTDYGLLRLPAVTQILRGVFARRRVILAPNADWMTAGLQERFGDIAEIRPNPFGVTSSWFEVERSSAPTQEWLVVSRITRNKLGDLCDWGDGFFKNRRRLRLLGPMQEAMTLPDWVEHEGSTHPAELRERWFPKVAGLLTLSRHDEGRPQVIIEAMAAGLPVIASRLPAHEDLIRHEETGWLVDSKEELAAALRQAEQPNIGAEVGRRARDHVSKQIGTWDDCASRCVAAYIDLLTTESRHAG